jgi:mono/diheme cytochrome c family protein
MRVRHLGLGVLNFAVLSLCVAQLGPATAHTPISTTTWTQQVGPLIQQRCAGCHRPGGYGPMSLLTYQEAREKAREIREEVQEGRMPMWPAARGFGDHLNDRTLSPVEIAMLTAWTSGGTPLGPDVPAGAESRKRESADLILTSSRESAPGASTEVYVLPTKLGRDRWLAGWEFRPGNGAVAQRATLSLESGERIGAWVPPDGAVRYPPTVGVRIPARSQLVLDVSYRKSAERQTDRSSVALYFAKTPLRPLRYRELRCGATPLEAAIDVLGVEASADGAGESVEVAAIRPDGSVEPLCLVRRFQPGHRPTFRLRNPVALPAGSVLEVRSSAPSCSAAIEFSAAQ